jgi:hypothetical protein
MRRWHGILNSVCYYGLDVCAKQLIIQRFRLGYENKTSVKGMNRAVRFNYITAIDIVNKL